MALLNLALYAACGAALTAAYTIIYMIYNAFFHPLSSFPGPKWWGASFLPGTVQSLKGRYHLAVKELHDSYGEVVRTGPNTLSYNSGEAWEEICGHIKGTHTKTFEKDYDFYGPTVSGAPNIIMAHEEDHRRFRKLLSHAFSEKALAEQEVFLQKHVHAFIGGLQAQITGPARGLICITDWFNMTSFDLIGDLAFGYSFRGVEKAELHPWVKITFDFIKMMEYSRCTRIFPSVEKVVNLLIPQSLKDVRTNHAAFSAGRAQDRVAMKTDRKDFMSYLVLDGKPKNLTDDELNENAGILVLAGSETTATVLSGTVYHLLTHPEVYQKLKEEIRGTFTSQEELTIGALHKLKYLNACLEEGLRIFPPAPIALPRVSPQGGAIVRGRFVPEGTIVGVGGWAASHSSSNFVEPDSYIPERWLGEAKFAGENKKAAQAFSYGPHNCIGKNLAWAEMRLILANLVWHFDMELPAENRGWFESNKVYMLWEKVDLHVKLNPRVS